MAEVNSSKMNLKVSYAQRDRTAVGCSAFNPQLAKPVTCLLYFILFTIRKFSLNPSSLFSPNRWRSSEFISL